MSDVPATQFESSIMELDSWLEGESERAVQNMREMNQSLDSMEKATARVCAGTDEIALMMKNIRDENQALKQKLITKEKEQKELAQELNQAINIIDGMEVEAEAAKEDLAKMKRQLEEANKLINNYEQEKRKRRRRREEKRRNEEMKKAQPIEIPPAIPPVSAAPKENSWQEVSEIALAVALIGATAYLCYKY
ncbi:Oidioi.mRNA.OKI2018_I69.XSR.g16401.t1.cds [Oikopleura dioica]|uniref:Oidioi.mRNA.OKI2018_I69.XSR.g16401.t1.cds n=1 Tax=Oikopleura dioica TaxID=34765 RepID=A0ABN7SL34_OIKDI|nr:Oidioi.mRNA.OKI2018_I69.XSR.g16401.t1.cds [Oikopleura dioica]